MAEVTVQDALEYCLENPDGLGVEELLARFPQHHGELGPLLALSSRIAEVAPPPVPADRRAAMKARLMEAAAQGQAIAVASERPTRPVVVQAGRKWDWIWAVLRRPALVASAMAVLLVAGIWWGAASALPDSPFYNIKLASENFMLSFAGGDADRANAHVRLANARLEDIQAMEGQGKLAEAGGAINNYQEHIKSASTLLKQTAGTSNEGVKAGISSAITNFEQTFKSFEGDVAALPGTMKLDIAQLYGDLLTIRTEIGDPPRIDVPDGIKIIPLGPTPSPTPGSPTPGTDPSETTRVVSTPTSGIIATRTPGVTGTSTRTAEVAAATGTSTAISGATRTATLGGTRTATAQPTPPLPFLGTPRPTRTATKTAATPTPTVTIVAPPINTKQPTRTATSTSTSTPSRTSVLSTPTRTPNVAPTLSPSRTATRTQTATYTATPPIEPSPTSRPPGPPAITRTHTPGPPPVTRTRTPGPPEPPGHTPHPTREVQPSHTPRPTNVPPRPTNTHIPPTPPAEPTSTSCELRIEELEVESSCQPGGEVDWVAEVENRASTAQEGDWEAVLKIKTLIGPYIEVARLNGRATFQPDSTTEIEGSFSHVILPSTKTVRVELTITRDGRTCDEKKIKEKECD
ncbi:MAG TPA: DUF5667 domain-containing protein [Chloroflexia bacterium]|nr:DUF5667 domain-containing protein [Chloroflexia bacterium]